MTSITYTTFDIVRFIEKNPLSRLNIEYQNALINKIKSVFNEEEQKLFVTSLYCYLHFNPTADFVIDFEDVWKWCGFSRKDHAKRILDKHFIIDIDYKVEMFTPQIGVAKPAPPIGGAGIKKLGGSGLNKEKITLNIRTFKKYCLKSNTDKSNEIHNYYIKLEEILHETLLEQTDELRLQLEQKHNELLEKESTLEIQKEEIKQISKEKEDEIKKIEEESELKLLENNEENRLKICEALVLSYDNKNVVYLGYIGIINGKITYKFGCSSKLLRRIRKQHKKTYEIFELVHCVECEQHVKLEQALKTNDKSKKYIFSHPFKVEGAKDFTNVTELIYFDDSFTLESFKKLLTKLKNNIEMVDELRIHLEKTEHLKLELSIKKEEEETKRIAKELEEQTKQKQLELEILKLKLEHHEKIREINDEHKNEEIKRFQEEIETKTELEREMNRHVQENNDVVFEKRIENKVVDTIDINTFSNMFQPIPVLYKDRETFLYVAIINDELYINLNSISVKSYPMERWKRSAEIQKKILEYNFKLQDKKMLSIYSHKNKGTWVLFTFFCRNYFNWYGSVYNKINNKTDYLSFGTFLEIQLPKLIETYNLATDKHFMYVKRENSMFKIRSNRDNNFINVTDLFNLNDRDIRSFNKSSEKNNYFLTNPVEHYLNGNEITDEFGMKVTYCHPKLATIIVDWLYKKKTDMIEEKQQLINFINYFADKV